jgi:hypothetical protein
MSDGMFDSGGDSGGSFFYWGSSSNGRPRPGETAATLVLCGIMLAIIVAVVVYQQYAKEEERGLDHTTYVVSSSSNFERWNDTQKYEVSKDSLWFEPGSSHREGGYHCKGGQFKTAGGSTVSFCCSVDQHDPIPCVVITP